jgi:hypothetical protein
MKRKSLRNPAPLLARPDRGHALSTKKSSASVEANDVLIVGRDGALARFRWSVRLA